jgi:hypothetical protein
MDNELGRTPLGVELLRTFAAIFTMAILAMTLAGVLIANYSHDTQEVAALFVIGRGLSYNVIFQLAGFALISAVFSTLLISERITKRINFIYRRLFLLLATLLTISVFSIVFKWFPVNNIQIWIIFILLFIAGFAVGLALTLLKLKLEKKKYRILLANYKARYNDR